MHPLIEELIEKARVTAQLDKHHLFSWEIYREKDALYQTRYLLSMEWFPLGIHKRRRGGMNPAGTAAIEIDMHSKQFNHIIFTEGKRSRLKVDDVEKWISEVAGIQPNQYTCVRDHERKYEFTASVNGISVHPVGFLNVETDEKENLVMFSQSGFFPNDEEAAANDFRLSTEDLTDTFFNQLKFLDFPSQKLNRWIPMYAIEEIFAVNQDTLITYDTSGDEALTVKVNENLTWQGTGDGKKSKLKSLEWNHEVVTIEHVLENHLHPDLVPITHQVIESVKITALQFMQNHFPEESGVWNLVNVRCDGGYIVVLLKMPHDKRAVPKWKRLFLDKEGSKVLQLVDNDFMLEMLGKLKQASETIITKEDAFNTLKPYFEVKPYYAYHPEQQKYVLCGKLDCKYGVAADTGEVTELDKI